MNFSRIDTYKSKIKIKFINGKYSCAQSFLIETISAFTQDILIRHQERRAEQQAFEYLGESHGAEKFFLTSPIVGYAHPPDEERLDYVRKFKPLSKIDK